MAVAPTLAHAACKPAAAAPESSCAFVLHDATAASILSVALVLEVVVVVAASEDVVVSLSLPHPAAINAQTNSAVSAAIVYQRCPCMLRPLWWSPRESRGSRPYSRRAFSRSRLGVRRPGRRDRPHEPDLGIAKNPDYLVRRPPAECVCEVKKFSFENFKDPFPVGQRTGARSMKEVLQPVCRKIYQGSVQLKPWPIDGS